MSLARIFSCMFAFLAITGICHAQELPIAVGDDDTFCGGGAFDGTNYCVMIWGDNASPYSITAQLVSPTGSLVGSRISLGRTGSNPVVAFDGSNYLAVWSDVFPRMASGDTNGIGNLYGQFISPAGNLVGPSFTLVTGVNIKSAPGAGRADISGYDVPADLLQRGPPYRLSLWATRQPIGKSCGRPRPD